MSRAEFPWMVIMKIWRQYLLGPSTTLDRIFEKKVVAIIYERRHQVCSQMFSRDVGMNPPEIIDGSLKHWNVWETKSRCVVDPLAPAPPKSLKLFYGEENVQLGIFILVQWNIRPRQYLGQHLFLYLDEPEGAVALISRTTLVL